LPWQGGNALALPNLDKLADVPVTAGPLPVSAELLRVRRIIAKQHEVYKQQHDPGIPREKREKAFAALRHEYEAVATIILDRPVTSWGQVREIAEIAWTEYPKEWALPADWEGRDDLDNASVLVLEDPTTHFNAGIHQRFALKAMARLIEAVLTLSGGSRRYYTMPGEVPVLQPYVTMVEVWKASRAAS
jgi:hypothetical protein